MCIPTAILEPQRTPIRFTHRIRHYRPVRSPQDAESLTLNPRQRAQNHRVNTGLIDCTFVRDPDRVGVKLFRSVSISVISCHHQWNSLEKYFQVKQG